MSDGGVSAGTCTGMESTPFARRFCGSAAAGTVVSLLGIAALLITACGSVPIPKEEMHRLYAAALTDVLKVEPDEVVEDLVVIRQGKPDAESGLQWMDGRVLVTTWTGARWLMKQGRRVTLHSDVWVTPDRVVQDFCRPLDTSEAELRLRLEQILGLPPESGRGRRFVELWVKPADLFRPCPDPAIDQVRCSPEVDPAEIPKEHRQWLAETAEAVHRPARAGGYPWTGLGYTYDWGDPYSEVGLSELVVHRRAQVQVGRVASTEDYCASDR